jgi:hypothetical protein
VISAGAVTATTFILFFFRSATAYSMGVITAMPEFCTAFGFVVAIVVAVLLVVILPNEPRSGDNSSFLKRVELSSNC